MKPYIPIYKRPPNKFIKYEERPFNYGYGQVGIERVAIFLNKNRKECEMIAQIIWRDPNETTRIRN